MVLMSLEAGDDAAAPEFDIHAKYFGAAPENFARRGHAPKQRSLIYALWVFR